MTEIYPTAFPTDELKQILAILHNCYEKKINWISSVDIQSELRDKYKIGIHWRKINHILADNLELIERKKIKKNWSYRITIMGERLFEKKDIVTIVDPNNPMQAVISIHNILSTLDNNIFICDPYLDYRTLNYLDSCPVPSNISFLSKRIKDDGRLRSYLLTLDGKGIKVEIRIPTTDILHDRYIIDKNQILFLGTSLNNFGKKQSFIFRLDSPVRSSVENMFTIYWTNANPWN